MIVVVENFAHTLQEVVGEDARCAQVVVTSHRRAAGLQGPARRLRAAPREEDGAGVVDLPGAIRLSDALADGRRANARARAARPRRHRVPAVHGRHDRRREGRDAAAPEHRRQPAAGARVGAAVPRRRTAREIIITPLPLYHIFSLTANCLMFMTLGAENVLIPNPRDIPGFVKEMAQVPVHRVHRRQHAVQRAASTTPISRSSISRRCGSRWAAAWRCRRRSRSSGRRSPACR